MKLIREPEENDVGEGLMKLVREPEEDDVGEGPMKLVREPEPSIRGMSPAMVVFVGVVVVTVRLLSLVDSGSGSS